jgi:hypothetical protein
MSGYPIPRTPGNQNVPDSQPSEYGKDGSEYGEDGSEYGEDGSEYGKACKTITTVRDHKTVETLRCPKKILIECPRQMKFECEGYIQE